MNTSQIAAIGVAIPSLSLPVEALASHLGVDPAKYRIGLGCVSQALCSPEENAVVLGRRAAEKALEAWGGDRRRIGMIAVGTETAMDMSRPLSAWIVEGLGLPENARSYEVKHACYAGTLALRQAMEWQRSGAARGKAALVVCADEALYAPGHPGEPTQGAAAVAIVLDAEGFAEVALHSYAFQRPAFDFWRPVGHPYPEVDGPLSIACYQDAFSSCLAQWVEDTDAPFQPADVARWSMHAPFPKMVLKGFVAGMASLGMSDDDAKARYEREVLPSLAWNAKVGNCYTASAWLSFARAISAVDVGAPIALFSYGSGCGAELLLIEKRRETPAALVADVEAQFARQEPIDQDRYATMRTVR